MDEQDLKKMSEDVARLLQGIGGLQQEMREQAYKQTLLLAVAKAVKMPRQDIEAAIDSLKLHPAVSADLKREAKKLIPLVAP